MKIYVACRLVKAGDMGWGKATFSTTDGALLAGVLPAFQTREQAEHFAEGGHVLTLELAKD